MRGVFVFERYWGFNKGYMGLVPTTTQGQFRQFKDNPQGQFTSNLGNLGNLRTIYKNTRVIHKDSPKEQSKTQLKKTKP